MGLIKVVLMCVINLALAILSLFDPKGFCLDCGLSVHQKNVEHCPNHPVLPEMYRG